MAGGAVAGDALAPFSPAVRAWFETSFPEPTAAQAAAWAPIAEGRHTLLCAPTGSGKTLAAFLWAIDRLGRAATDAPTDSAPVPGVKVVYVSPLRALAVDIEKNLRSPLRGIALAAERIGERFVEPTVGVRTGDTSATERRNLVRRPPDILITTPESLYLMLTSAARETLLGVQSVIVDEIHALAPTKRGAHLALTLERLEQLVAHGLPDADGAATATRPAAQPTPDAQPTSDAAARRAAVQRIGLSATQRPLEVVAGYLGGATTVSTSGDGGDSGDESTVVPRPVRIVDAAMRKELELQVVVPVDDMSAPGDGPSGGPGPGGAPGQGIGPGSIWPSMHPELLQLVEDHHSTLVFVNARRLAERLASRLNELAAEQRAEREGHEPPVVHHGGEAMGVGASAEHELVKAHHGSLSRERRLFVEDELKRGEVRGLVATSSLELGIDMGAVDLVVQVESPGSVASGLQRIGRAGHQVGAPSRGRIFPKHRADLLEAAVVVQRMHDGLIEHTRVPVNPLDVLAQQIVAACALDEWSVSELFDLCRRADNYRSLTRELFENTLDLLSGRYPAEEFSELRPRLVWDRLAGTVRGRAGAQRLAVTSGGTIPDRGLFGVFLPDGTRVGELDEEMVYESRVGETFLLGASTWRIEDITFERVVVTPAPGQPGKMPFWHGDGPGREAELGRALGEFTREIRSMPPTKALEVLRDRNKLDARAATNLLAYLDEQADATGAVPDDRTIVVERFRDEIGDWRICIHSPFGARVHAPWATIIRTRLAQHFDESDNPGGFGAEVLWSDDGIVIRLPEAVDQLPLDLVLPDPDEVEPEIVAALPGTAAFAARFREAAARALLLPRRRPDQRTPLWQQRQRASDLLGVASKYPSFPILLEATRECCNDVFDLPALRRLLTEVRSRTVRVVEVETPAASPFARSLLFGWIAVFMYEGDAPLAERRAAALALDRDLLRDLLGAEELRSLLDASVVDTVELELQRLAEGRGARDADELHDLLRVLGPLTELELAARADDAVRTQVRSWLAELLDRQRVLEVSIAGEQRYAAAEDAARLRDALGIAVPVGLPTSFTDPVDTPLRDLVERYARTHGPFTTPEVVHRLGASAESVAMALDVLAEAGRVVAGEFRPGGVHSEWCDADVLRQIRRRSLAALRNEVAPVEGTALARFLPRWQGIGSSLRGVDAVADTVGVLQGAAIPASLLEPDVLSLRVAGYQPSDLDLLCTTGEVVWLGAGSVGAHDGRVRLVFRDQVPVLVPEPGGDLEPLDHHDVLRAHLAERGASFWSELVAATAAASLPYDDETVLAALWDLVWSGEVTNDSLAPLRAKVAGGAARRASGARSRRPRGGTSRRHARGSAAGPPAAAGRWSLTAPLFEPRPSPTEAITQRALQLLERYGVLTREMALAEGAEGGFAGVYPVLKLLEERGQVRRGYFVDGLGAAQFAKPGAVDLLRAAARTDDGSEADPLQRHAMPWEPAAPATDAPVELVLAATDPAQPYGAALPWPESSGHPARAVGAYVVLIDGTACAYLERGGTSVLTFPGAAEHERWPSVLAQLVRTGRVRRLRVQSVDGVSVASSEVVDELAAAGFVDGYKGMTLGT